jgi:hypothetical protein
MPQTVFLSLHVVRQLRPLAQLFPLTLQLLLLVAAFAPSAFLSATAFAGAVLAVCAGGFAACSAWTTDAENKRIVMMKPSKVFEYPLRITLSRNDHQFELEKFHFAPMEPEYSTSLLPGFTLKEPGSDGLKAVDS